MSKEDELLVKLRSAFQVEAEEHLQAMASGLLELERAEEPAQRKEIVAAVFREAHSLKGAARAVNLNQIETICQSLESVFAAWRRRDTKPGPELFDPLHRAIDLISGILPSSSVGEAALDTIEQISALLRQLASIEETTTNETSAIGEVQTHTPAPEVQAPRSVPKTVLPETLRISTAKLDGLLLRAEELLAVKLSTNQRAVDLQNIVEVLELWEKEWAKISPEWRHVRQILEPDDRSSRNDSHVRQALTAATSTKLAEFLNWNEGWIKSLRHQMAALVKSADHDRRVTTGMVDTLLEDSKKLLMLPFSSLFEMFPKLVRDLSRVQGKEIELEIRGAEVEIDKRILEEMKDPLVHLLRNSVDHGIERPEERRGSDKPARGTIVIAVSQVEANKVEILVADDGMGIDSARVKAAVIRQGLRSEEEVRAMDEAEALELIFQTEVSTSPIITEISGRGLGLSIVKEKVEKLGGRVAVETHPHQGTTFRLRLPLTLATFRGILVEAADRIFVMPTAGVERVLRIQPDEIGTVENRETIRLNGRPVALVQLTDVLELPRSQKAETSFIPVMVLGTGDKRIAFRVDAVLDEREVLVKPLCRPLARVRNIAGATVLGSGKAVPILHVPDLMKSASKVGARVTAGAPDAKPKAERHSILVVDDSITARMLLKNIFESAGYRVKTAVDGVEAFTALKTEPFDLLVSDVQMPRMDGFELTSKLRGDKKLAEVPVVLVTALASPEDRERGIDVGADAYIVKSHFDQSDLLEVARRLL